MQSSVPQLITELKSAILVGEDDCAELKTQLLSLLKVHYESIHAQVQKLKPLLEQRKEMQAQQVRNARRTQLYNLNSLLDTKLAAKCYDLDTLSTLKVGLEVMKELEERDEQVIRMQRFQYTVRKQADDLMKDFFLDGTGKEQLVGCLKAINILSPHNDVLLIVKRYVSYMTEEYSNIFTQYGEQLETIAYRLAWIKRVVAKYEHSHATVFPVEWQVMETLITKCCDLVSQDVQRVVGTLKPHEHHILQTQLQEAIGLEEVLASKITKKNMDFGLVTAFEPVIYLIIAEHDNALSAFISGLEVKKASPSVHITSNLDRECVYEIWKSGLELWERSENALQDVACVSTGKPLVRVLQVIDDAITDYAQYVMRIQGKKKYRPHILVTSMNTVSYVFRLRTEEDSSIGYGMELCITQTIKQLASQLANTLVSGEEEMKAERLEEVLSQVLSTSAREEVAEAFIRQAVAGISKQINSKMWSVEGAAQRRLQLSAYSDDIRAVLPFTTRSIWSHAVQPLDDLLCILMTPLEENHDALVDLYLLKSSPYGFTNQEDFARRMGLREDWQRQKKLLLASFLKKVPPKPSQLNN